MSLFIYLFYFIIFLMRLFLFVSAAVVIVLLGQIFFSVLLTFFSKKLQL